ncbi:Ger(x)C family spore germination protein [Paenibacillus frigoriresistens]|uniref:Ger(x)C family spore germination protein n=1 Tax=Paenibacillus alginolyticus TaxID=59839 RepID=UPI00156394DA|nr:Ger(x)C family spore germination protein [Paenibacillus frigoriresistens]NRF96102.1 Ger(x)C family spore germination protein [Paenibacillus frigoriresistens]
MQLRMKLIWLLLLCSNLMLITGCWSRIEVNDRAFVTGMYIDRSDNGSYEVSLGFPLPNRMAGGQSPGMPTYGNPYTILTKTAESIPVAIRKIRSDLTREITWGHCRVIVVGKQAAEYGIDSLLEFVAREPNFHTKSYLMVAPGKARDITKLTPVFERLPAEVLREFSNRKVTLDTNVKDFLEASTSGGDMIAGMLTTGQTEMLSEKGKESTWVGTDGAALFKKGKMIGTLDVIGMRAGLWLKGKMKSSQISLKSPSDGKTMSFIILSSKASIKPFIDGEKIGFHIKIEAEDDILSSESDIDLTDPKEIIRIQEQLSEQLKRRITRTLYKTQDMGADVFQFGRHLDWNYPKVWSKHKDGWHADYKMCTFIVDTNVQVKRIGVERNSIIRQHEDRAG